MSNHDVGYGPCGCGAWHEGDKMAKPDVPLGGTQVGVQRFPTGAVRSDKTGRGRFDLIDPFSLERLAKCYEGGCKPPYGERNWERGIPLSSFVSSLLRHLTAYMKGDRSEDHPAAIAFNVFGVMRFEELIRLGKADQSLDDLPRPLQTGAVAPESTVPVNCNTGIGMQRKLGSPYDLNVRAG